VAFSPRTRLLYIPANENLCETMTGAPVSYSPGQRYVGATYTFSIAAGADHVGEVQAWNIDTGKRVWTHTYATSPNWGPMLATGGGLVFSGGTNDREFHAFDARNGKLLWRFPTNSGIIGQPTSFLAGGASIVAVQSGGAWIHRDGDAAERLRPGTSRKCPRAGHLVFAIK
jgi:alcohol dehydrogenase (cytochrome c)